MTASSVLSNVVKKEELVLYIILERPNVPNVIQNYSCIPERTKRLPFKETTNTSLTTKKNKKEEFGHFLNVVQFPINQLKNVITDGTEVLQ